MAAYPFLFGPYVIKEPCPNIRRANAALNFITKHIFNNMKKFLLFAAAVLAFASCEKPAQDTPEPGTDPTEDVISINPKEKAFGNGGGSVDVKVTSSADWTLTSGNEYSWVTVSATAGKNGATVKFDVKANETEQEQKAVFTFTCGKATATFNITVAAGDAPDPAVEFDLSDASQKNLSFEATGGNAMVNFKTSLNKDAITLKKSDGADWVTAQLAQTTAPVLGIIIPANTNAERTATLTLSAEGANDIVINITQKGGGEPAPSDKINVVNFDGACLYSNWPNPAPLTDLSQFTAEMLMTAESFSKRLGPDSEINTLLGIEAKFLIRIIGKSDSEGDIEVVYDNNGECKLNSVATVNTNKWYHIATTFDNGKIALYVNGEKKGEKTLDNGITTMSLQTGEWTAESGWGSKRNFYLGFSCDNRRCLKGTMSEVRIWNKVLTESELKANGHFYSVDAASSGLIAYWKLNEGSGNVAKDATSNGNDLYGHTSITGNNGGGSNQNTEGIQWAEVDDIKVE